MNKKARIYIAGHNGMVGSALYRKLTDKGFENIITRRHAEVDLTIQSDVEHYFNQEKPEYVFLAAAKVGGIIANDTFKADFIYENIMIAANVIHASYHNGVKKLLNLGSSCIYPKYSPQPMKEEYLLTDTLEPTNEPYAIAKIAAIKLCRYFNEQYGTDYLSVMPTNLYGPHDNYNLLTSHALPALIRKIHIAKLFQSEDYEGIIKDFSKYAISDEPVKQMNKKYIAETLCNIGINKEHVTLWGTGSPYREFLYSDDLAEASIFLMTNYDAQEVGEFVNIGTGKDVTIRELASIVKGIVGFKGDIKWDKSKPDGTPRKLLSVEKINKLGWEAKVSLEEGIRMVYEEYVM